MSPPELARQADVRERTRLDSNALGSGDHLALVQPLFDHLHDVPFYIKDQRLEFLVVNQAMARLCGAKDSATLVGQTARQVLPEQAAAQCEELERRAMQSRRAMRNHLVQVAAPLRQPVWMLVTLIPLPEPNGRAVAGLGRVLEVNDRRQAIFERVAQAVASIASRLGARIRVSELAHEAGVSVSQIERDFADVFDMSPNRYIAEARLESAMDLLRGSDSIADIAHACGYADQSAFTRRFQAALSLTPSEFRRRAIREQNALHQI